MVVMRVLAWLVVLVTVGGVGGVVAQDGILHRGGSGVTAGSQTVPVDVATAEVWSRLVLKAIDQEYPSKPSVVVTGDADVLPPRTMFPAFHGCFDWHSSVHGHWLLVRLLRLCPEMATAAEVRSALNRHLSAENLQAETAFFSRDEHKSFERMYGWAWYLRLVIETGEWDDPDAGLWHANLAPLEQVLVSRIEAYLPLLSFPVRSGEHPDTGFAVGQIIDYARFRQNSELETLVKGRARDWYLDDRDYPVEYEPSGQDFFSSAWNETDAMRRVLEPAEFEEWLKRFLPGLPGQLVDGKTIHPVEVSDVTDGKLVHLAGLNLHRAWCMQSVAASLPAGHRLRAPLETSAAAHLVAGLKYVNSGHYEGDHWLATFAVYAMTEVGSEDSK